MDLEQIGKTCHSIHLAYCNELGIETQPIWSEISLEHKDTIINSVKKIIYGDIKSKEESHNNFVNLKKSNGWKYGDVYSLEQKTNPRLIPFNELSIEDKIKESLFYNCVISFLK